MPLSRLRASKPVMGGAIFGLILLATWLFVGFYRDREWSGLYVFLKHRPSFQLIFHAPRGEAERSLVPGHEGYLSQEQEKEEEVYIDFVERHGGYRRSIYLPLP